jgi:hypothetical protein
MITSSDTQNLYLDFRLDEQTHAALAEWDGVLAEEPPLPSMRWHLRLEAYMRHAAIGASTRIEGNPLTLAQTDALLEGETVTASPVSRQEVQNYARALDVGSTLAQDPGFTWTETTVRLINAEVMRDLPDDTQGHYRLEPIGVGSLYTAPEHQIVPDLMRRWTAWLQSSTDHDLVRVALLHLNLVAIHPWVNGNGRSARILSSMDLMRGIRAPELVSIEPVLAERQDDYFRMIREALGPRYAPDRHSVSEWVAWYVGLHTSRLGEGQRLWSALTNDIGTIISALQRRGEPMSWGPVLSTAAVVPITTRDVMSVTDGREAAARGILRRMAEAGWLTRQGRTRGVHYVATDQVVRLNLGAPRLIRQYVRSGTLGL